VFDYWFNDGPVSTFPAGFSRTQIANLFDGKADTATWFGNAPGFEHGIQFLPFTGASLYLGRDRAYVGRNLAEVTRATGGAIDKGGTNWPDLMEMYQAFVDPRQALAAWQSTRYVFDGESRAHEFAWLQSMAALGRVDQSVTADTPFYAVFRSETGQRSHIAFNPGRAPLTVHFSDGFSLSLGPRTMASEAGVTRLPQ
jgi:endoglucanase Acf2